MKGIVDSMTDLSGVLSLVLSTLLTALNKCIQVVAIFKVWFSLVVKRRYGH